MIELARSTWPEARALARDPRAVVLLPLGAIEQHGPHLPLLVDWLGAEALARQIAPGLRRGGYRPVLVPSLPYGVSGLAEAWSGTASLAPATLRALVIDVVASLARHGFRRFVLANYQADPGHLAAIAAARRRLARRGVQVLVAGFSPDPEEGAAMLDPRVLGLLRSPRPEREWHGGELETALVLAVAPRLLRRGVARRLPPLWVDFRKALAAGARTFEAMAPRGRGYFGSPRVARAATGRAALALRGRLIVRHLLHALDRWRPPRRRREGTK